MESTLDALYSKRVTLMFKHCKNFWQFALHLYNCPANVQISVQCVNKISMHAQKFHIFCLPKFCKFLPAQILQISVQRVNNFGMYKSLRCTSEFIIGINANHGQEKVIIERRRFKPKEKVLSL